VRPDHPIRLVVGLDLFAGQPFVVAVVPFGEQFVGLINVQARQFGGALRPSPWGCDDVGMVQVRLLADPPQSPRIVLALFGEVDVRAAGVLIRQGPFGLAMPDDQGVSDGLCKR